MQQDVQGSLKFLQSPLDNRRKHDRLSMFFKFCGLEKRSSRHAHNVKIIGSNPIPASFLSDRLGVLDFSCPLPCSKEKVMAEYGRSGKMTLDNRIKCDRLSMFFQ